MHHAVNIYDCMYCNSSTKECLEEHLIVKKCFPSLIRFRVLVHLQKLRPKFGRKKAWWRNCGQKLAAKILNVRIRVPCKSFERILNLWIQESFKSFFEKDFECENQSIMQITWKDFESVNHRIISIFEKDFECENQSIMQIIWKDFECVNQRII